MIALGPYQWTLLVLLGACYLAICLRTAMRMAHTGRNLCKWFIISVFCTSIPAAAVLLREQMRGLRRRPDGRRPAREPPDGPLVRCQQCGKRIRRADLDTIDGIVKCPYCGLPIDEANYG